MQEDVAWCMLFANDIVLIDEKRTRLYTILDFWRKTLENKDLKNQKKEKLYRMRIQ